MMLATAIAAFAATFLVGGFITAQINDLTTQRRGYA